MGKLNMKYKLLKNKKGIAPLVIVALVGIPLFLLLVGGGLTAWKISQVTSSIPTWVWIGIAFLIILMFLPKRKK